MMFAAIAAALLSCQSKSGQKENSVPDKVTAVSDSSSAVSIFEGVMPATDGPGIKYQLTLKNASPDKEGTYTLVTTYLDADGKGLDQSYTSKGKQRSIHKNADNQNKTVYRLTPDNGDDPVYFVVVDSVTLRLVGDDLQESASGLNYDIVRVR